MMTHTQGELLGTLAELCEILPEHRFAQMLCNLTSFVALVPESTWTVPDDLLLTEAERFLETQRRRLDLPRASHPATFLTDPVRRELFAEIRYLADHSQGRTLGRIVADLVRREVQPATIQEWAGALWDIDDADLLALIRAERADRSLVESASTQAASEPTPPAEPS